MVGVTESDSSRLRNVICGSLLKKKKKNSKSAVQFLTTCLICGWKIFVLMLKIMTLNN